VPSKRYAGVKANEQFMSVRAMSGYRLLYADPASEEIVLPLAATDEEVGRALVLALGQSRALSLDEAESLSAGAAERYERWVQGLVKRFGYNTRRALFRHMKSCDIAADAEQTVIAPTRHERLEGWGRTKGDDIEDVAVPAGADHSTLGAAVRAALARCQ
jgi:hypothetical protein